MKRMIAILITSMCLISVNNLSFAKLGIRKPVVIPAEMYKINLPFELEVYLDNPDGRTREAVVKRLGQIGGTDAISVLLKFYENEPELKGVIDVPYGIKDAVAVALRQIGNKEAKDQIVKILKDTLRFGPFAEGYQEKRYTGQAKHIIYLSLEALSDFPDNDVISILKEITKNQNPLHNGLIAETAWKSSLKIEIKKQGIKGLEAKVKYLVNMLTRSGKGSGAYIEGKRTEEALKNGAIQEILIDFRTPALPYFEKSLDSIPKNSPRAKAIKDIIAGIEMRSKNKSKYKTNESVAIPSKGLENR